MTLVVLLQCVSLAANAQAATPDSQAPNDAQPPPVLRIEPLPEVPAAPVPPEPADTEARGTHAAAETHAPAEIEGLPAPPSRESAPEETARKERNTTLIYVAPILALGAVGAITLGVLVGRACAGWQEDGSCAMPTMLAATSGFAIGALLGLGVGALIDVAESKPAKPEPAPLVRVGLSAGADGAALQLNGRF